MVVAGEVGKQEPSEQETLSGGGIGTGLWRLWGRRAVRQGEAWSDGNNSWGECHQPLCGSQAGERERMRRAGRHPPVVQAGKTGLQGEAEGVREELSAEGLGGPAFGSRPVG